MSTDIPTLGPVDIAVVAFPEVGIGSSFTQAVAETIASGAVRLLDAIIVQKDDDGALTIVDLDESGVQELLPVRVHRPGLVGDGDATDIADGIEPGCTAVVLAWENIWAARMRRALDDAGGVLVLHERAGDDDVTAALASLATTEGH